MPEQTISAAVMVTMDVTGLPIEAMPQLVTALRQQLVDIAKREFPNSADAVTLLLPGDVSVWVEPE